VFNYPSVETEEDEIQKPADKQRMMVDISASHDLSSNGPSTTTRILQKKMIKNKSLNCGSRSSRNISINKLKTETKKQMQMIEPCLTARNTTE
jgi:hypothetical protein